MAIWRIHHGKDYWQESEINFCLEQNIVVIGGDDDDLFSDIKVGESMVLFSNVMHDTHKPLVVGKICSDQNFVEECKNINDRLVAKSDWRYRYFTPILYPIIHKLEDIDTSLIGGPRKLANLENETNAGTFEKEVLIPVFGVSKAMLYEINKGNIIINRLRNIGHPPSPATKPISY
ncbi:MAG: hypothetical protein QM537_01840 [Candidatus Symbiobacter sp.]|nr:hypothetical protein [Candidatus Symbiobacter sp.]